MTLDELDDIRRRWHPDTDWTRTPQEADDVRRLILALDQEAAYLASCQLLLGEIANSVRPLPAGFSDRARQLLAEQNSPALEAGEPTAFAASEPAA